MDLSTHQTLVFIPHSRLSTFLLPNTTSHRSVLCVLCPSSAIPTASPLLSARAVRRKHRDACFVQTMPLAPTSPHGKRLKDCRLPRNGCRLRSHSGHPPCGIGDPVSQCGSPTVPSGHMTTSPSQPSQAYAIWFRSHPKTPPAAVLASVVLVTTYCHRRRGRSENTHLAHLVPSPRTLKLHLCSPDPRPCENHAMRFHAPAERASGRHRTREGGMTNTCLSTLSRRVKHVVSARRLCSVVNEPLASLTRSTNHMAGKDHR